MSVQTVVAADLEGTLTTGTMWKGMASYLRHNGQALPLYWFLATHLPQVPLAKVGILDVQAFKHRWVEDLLLLMRGLSVAQMEEAAEWVVTQKLWPGRRVEVVAELQSHQQAGHHVVLASGTYQPVLNAFARQVGENVSAIGTPLEFVDGRLTGRISGPINTGEAKAQRLRAFLDGKTLHAAYGDTLADLPMLEASQSPVVICPDPELRHTATQRGWRIVAA